MATGLKACGVLKCMQTFLALYVPLFMHTVDLCCEDAIYCDDCESDVALAYLQRFIRKNDNSCEYCLPLH